MWSRCLFLTHQRSLVEQRRVASGARINVHAPPQDWEALIEAGHVPLGLWALVAHAVRGRLSDKAASVRKCAARTLLASVCGHPFGSLKQALFEAKLAAAEAEFAERAPAEAPEDAATGAQTVASFMHPPLSPGPRGRGTTPARRAGGGQDENRAPQPGAAPAPPRPYKHPLATLRAHIATLKSALEYLAELHAALPALDALLASPSSTDVEAAIQLLKALHHAGLPAAAASLHGVLRLVFSRDAAVRDVVLDAFAELYIGDVRFPAAAAHLPRQTRVQRSVL